MPWRISENIIGAAVIEGEASNGELVSGTSRVLDAPTGEDILGRVIRPTGEVLDGGRKNKTCSQKADRISGARDYGQEPGKIRPLQTGILSFDSMIPIGRGQRELIIGDRQTGKTALPSNDTQSKESCVICIYCAIGQKASTVAEVVETLKQNEALDYTVVVSSHGERPGRHAVYYSLRRLRDGGWLHVRGQGIPGYLRRPEQTRGGLPLIVPSASQAVGS